MPFPILIWRMISNTLLLRWLLIWWWLPIASVTLGLTRQSWLSLNQSDELAERVWFLEDERCKFDECYLVLPEEKTATEAQVVTLDGEVKPISAGPRFGYGESDISGTFGAARQ